MFVTVERNTIFTVVIGRLAQMVKG